MTSKFFTRKKIFTKRERIQTLTSVICRPPHRLMSVVTKIRKEIFYSCVPEDKIYKNKIWK